MKRMTDKQIVKMRLKRYDALAAKMYEIKDSFLYNELMHAGGFQGFIGNFVSCCLSGYGWIGQQMISMSWFSTLCDNDKQFLTEAVAFMYPNTFAIDNNRLVVK